MRQISFEEAGAVSGADCGDLTMSVGLTGVSITGALSDWADCLTIGLDYLVDQFNSWSAHNTTGIPYGEAHVG